jgi:hypothetical protein
MAPWQPPESLTSLCPEACRTLKTERCQSNTCDQAVDGYCDDGGPGAEYGVCTLGSDCRDCGGLLAVDSECEHRCIYGPPVWEDIAWALYEQWYDPLLAAGLAVTAWTMTILQTRRLWKAFASNAVGLVALAVLVALWWIWDKHKIAQYDYSSDVYDLRPEERAHVTSDEAKGRARNFAVLAALQFALILWACYTKFKGVSTLNRRLKELHTRGGTYLPDLLQDGTIRLVDLEWLQTAVGFKRRQGLPEEAFVPLGSAVQIFHDSKVAVLSYRWLPGGGSDNQDGFHLRALQVFCSGKYGRQYKAVFIDYLCLFQGDDRSLEEKTKFDLALTVMMCLYASPLTVILQHKELPSSPSPGWDSSPYEKSGWCNMEQASATLATEAGSKLIRIRSDGASRVRLDPLQPRPTAAKMAEFFQDDSKCNFFNPKDRIDCAKMYSDFYLKMVEFDSDYKPWIAYIGDRFMESIYTRTLRVVGNAPRVATHASNVIVIVACWLPGLFLADLLQVRLRTNTDRVYIGIFGVLFFICLFFPFASRQWRRWMNYYLENLACCHTSWESFPSPLGDNLPMLSYAQDRPDPKVRGAEQEQVGALQHV